jgi:hypothetical protein
MWSKSEGGLDARRANGRTWERCGERVFEGTANRTLGVAEAKPAAARSGSGAPIVESRRVLMLFPPRNVDVRFRPGGGGARRRRMDHRSRLPIQVGL